MKNKVNPLSLHPPLFLFRIQSLQGFWRNWLPFWNILEITHNIQEFSFDLLRSNLNELKLPHWPKEDNTEWRLISPGRDLKSACMKHSWNFTNYYPLEIGIIFGFFISDQYDNFLLIGILRLRIIPIRSYNYVIKKKNNGKN